MVNAELSNQTAAAAREAELILGEPVLINGRRYDGVFGSATVTDVPNASGGYTRKVLVTFVTTRAQYDIGPTPKQGLTRISPRIDYLIDAVDAHDATHYTLALVKNGA